jgi:hypothetical protein
MQSWVNVVASGLGKGLNLNTYDEAIHDALYALQSDLNERLQSTGILSANERDARYDMGSYTMSGRASLPLQVKYATMI